MARPRGFHRRDTLLALFWPETDEPHARNALRQAVHHLRQALGADAIHSRGDELGLVPDRIGCDVVVFDDAITAGDLEGALAVYGGDLLPGLFLSGAPEFEHWLEEERARLRAVAARAARGLADREAATGQAGTALHWARRAVAFSGDDEEAVRWATALLERLGDRAGALRMYHEFARRLAEEFDAEPSVETRAVADRLKARTAPTALAVPAVEAATPEVPRPAPAGGPGLRRHRVRAGLVAGLAILIVVSAWIAWNRWGRVVLPGEPDLVAVLPFGVVGLDDPYLGDVIATHLAGRLDGAGPLRSVSPRVLTPVTHGEAVMPDDAARGRSLAARVGARLYVLGEAIAEDSVLEIRAALYDRGAGPRPVARGHAAGAVREVVTIADEVALQLLRTRRAAGDPPELGRELTRSLSALRAYLQGEAAYRAGRFDEAVPWFERAVALDSTFAAALYRLAVSSEWAGRQDAAWRALAAAERLGDGLSQRERSLVEAFTAYLSGRAIAAEWHYRNLLSSNAADVEAWSMLGETLFHFNTARGRAFTASREPLERALALEPGNANTLLHLVRLGAFEGRRGELESLVRRFLAVVPIGDRAVEARAILAYTTDDADGRREVAAHLDTAGSVLLDVVVTAVALYANDLDGAILVAQRFDHPRHSSFWRMRGLIQRAHLEAARGQWRRAWAELAETERLDPAWSQEIAATLALVPGNGVTPEELRARRAQLRIWYREPRPAQTAPFDPRPYDREWGAYLAGLISAALAEPGELDRDIRALESTAGTPTHVAVASLFRATLRAAGARLAGETWSGLTILEDANVGPGSPANTPFHSLAHERLLRARLLGEVGRSDEAVQWYASFPGAHGRDLPFVAPVRLEQGALLEQLGDRRAAAECYAEVIRLWGEGDASVRPVVEEARAGLRRVGGGR